MSRHTMRFRFKTVVVVFSRNVDFYNRKSIVKVSTGGKLLTVRPACCTKTCS